MEPTEASTGARKTRNTQSDAGSGSCPLRLRVANGPQGMKIAVIGCGLRTPLLIHGLSRSGLGLTRLALYDPVPGQAELMAILGRAVAEPSKMQIAPAALLEDAVADSSFVMSCVRVGGMETRARDERLAFECGFAGQETTGPAGCAMALRTVRVVLEQARVVERIAPDAWIVNFTNPAGLITQAISSNSGARVVGICDTPAELIFRIAIALRAPFENVECDYFGLNHLGWIQAVRLQGEDVTGRVLDNDDLLRSLYPAKLFSPMLIRSLGLIPSEYLFFYYRQRAARENQRAAGATRGEELVALNQRVASNLESNVKKGDVPAALKAYREYLNRRNASYMRLEGLAKSALNQAEVDENPFESATGYHRIAVEAIRALCNSEPSRLILNFPNQGAIEDLEPDDVIEVPCLVNKSGIRPIPVGALPETVRGLTTSVKACERLIIQAALRRAPDLATLGLFVNPIVADWDLARNFIHRLIESDPFHLGGFTEAASAP